MKFWLHIHNTQPEQMVELACLAEQVGYGRGWAMTEVQDAPVWICVSL